MHGGNIMYNICDIHSHIIPQVDDGAIDLNMSIQMLRDAYNQGTRSIICTSHSYGDIMKYYENLNIVKEELKRQNKELRDGVPKDNIKIWDNNNKLHNENESLKIQNESMFEYIKEKGLGEEAQIVVNKKIRQKTNNKIKAEEWQQEL